MTKSHKKRTTYVCTGCSFSSTDIRALKIHAKTDHDFVRCRFCNKNFSRREILLHLNSCEEDELKRIEIEMRSQYKRKTWNSGNGRREP